MDYFLAGHDVLESVESCRVIPTACSDHKLVVMEVNCGEQTVWGPGLWKHNDRVLRETERQRDSYVIGIEKAITNVLNSDEVQGHRRK